jgi:hypothetical protein
MCASSGFGEAAHSQPTRPENKKVEKLMLKTVIMPFIVNYAPNMIRHGAQAAAGALVTNGILTADQGTAVAGALLTLATIAWSIAEKRGLIAKIFA